MRQTVFQEVGIIKKTNERNLYEYVYYDDAYKLKLPFSFIHGKLYIVATLFGLIFDAKN